MEVRQAKGADAPHIVELIQQSFEPRMLEFFIYGCDGVTRYVEQQIEAGPLGGDTAYFVTEEQDRVIACAELRRVADQLFLNYIAVDVSARTQGMGRRLLATALAALRTTESGFSLDVLEDNATARRWYDSLGLGEDSVTSWYQLPQRRVTSAPGSVVGFPQARACHAMFGFSQLTIRCGPRTYAVGMLGEHLYRLTDPACISDDALLATLQQLDARRDLLLFAPSSAAIEAAPVARTIRRSAPLDVVLSRLERT